MDSINRQKKIGICTLYYKNRNYGANLQAYALRKVVGMLGYEAELVTYYNNTKFHKKLSDIKQSLRKTHPAMKEINLRNKAIDRFCNSIPHSRLFFSDTLKEANNDYYCFIVGSDQVWNPAWINPFLSLSFVNSGKKTIAYAASTGKIHLDTNEKTRIKGALDRTDFISIREKESIPALQTLTTKDITYVLDPTMLLSADAWDEICSERLINQEYLFCYFLSGNENLRSVAREFANERNLKIVSLPFLNGVYRKVDDGFADCDLFNVSPTDFLSLVKYSKFVLTDSFHAAVFSHIYKRPFVVTGNKNNEMGCRMHSLTDMYGTSDRFFPDYSLLTKEKIATIADSALLVDEEKFMLKKNESINFLKHALG